MQRQCGVSVSEYGNRHTSAIRSPDGRRPGSAAHDTGRQWHALRVNCVSTGARPDHMHALLRMRLTTWGGASVHYLLIASPVAPLANLIHIGAEDALGALG